MFYIGADEVGRGSLAGPVVAGAVCFEQGYVIKDKCIPVLINDSKKLTPKQRKESAEWIYRNASSWGIGIGSVTRINKEGIVKATNAAFRRAIKECHKNASVKPQKLFIDAFFIPYVDYFPKNIQSPIIKGDSKIFEIAAASIIAKVYRDELMQKLGLSKKYAVYFWVNNKGYGTQQHTQAIIKNGMTKHHRVLFCKSYNLKNGESSDIFTLP